MDKVSENVCCTAMACCVFLLLTVHLKQDMQTAKEKLADEPMSRLCMSTGITYWRSSTMHRVCRRMNWFQRLNLLLMADASIDKSTQVLRSRCDPGAGQKGAGEAS